MMDLDHLSPRQVQELIYHLASGLAAETGEDFLFSLLGHLSRALGADFALVGELLPDEEGRVGTLAVLADGKKTANFVYDLRGTPCEQVIGQDACVFPRDVRKLFPEDHMLVDMGIEGYAGRPLIDSQGNPLGLLVVLFCRPVPNPLLTEQLLRVFAVRASSELERLRHEASLRASERRFRQLSTQFELLLAGIPDRICLLDADWHAVWTNHLEALASHGTGQRRCFEDLNNRSEPCPDCPVTETFATRQPASGQVTHADGQIWSVRTFPLDDEQGAPQALVIAEEITEKFRLQQQTLRTGQLAALGELAAGIAHEINNPVSGVINYAELLRNRLEKEGESVDLVNRIIKEGDRIAAIARQMLFLARDTKGEMTTLDLVDILAGTLWFIAGHLHKDGIELDVDLAEGLPTIRGQAQQLQQLLLNLLSNARYALNRRYPEPSPAKRVRVSLAQASVEQRPVLRLRVCDLGCGIPAEILPRVLQPFVTSKPSTEGTGLGLSICHEIVKQHGGTIWVESREGDFTEVIVDLPISDQEETHDTTHIGRR